MYPLLSNHIARYVSVDEQDLHTFCATLKSVKLRKYQYLLQEGTICRHDYFVIKGGVRQYEVDDKGREKVIHFGFEDWWINDRYSWLTSSPSIYNIQALEPTEVLQIEKDTLEQLFITIPRLERYFHIVLQHAFANWQGRILVLQKPAIERYAHFRNLYGHLENRLSQQHVASYLGITRESLSRLRNHAAQPEK
ncbi:MULTISPECIES: Crp/Fnr family transcriptional regulator [Niastella]|uniref:Crp/Fnr family transcriptional regulator n=1 Tax=Niastella soli TaxID=2821487 RepID=A0ABS3Z060_9BACT|nr:Crp/Fnr family transcriptional regulator [Niastella soli]MBO9203050.1 Crp/Fnr family transcriptional regulator [Niastella soli]